MTRQRLTGIIALLALGIIFLPSLFYREEKVALTPYSDSVSSRIPPRPIIEPVVIAPPEEKPPTLLPAPAPERSFQPPVNETADDVNDNIAVAPEAIPKPTLNAEGLPNAWVVQVGSFSSQARANELVNKLLSRDYKAYARKVKTTKGEYVRVLVGPYIDKGRALSGKKALDKTYQLKSQVLRFSPE